MNNTIDKYIIETDNPSIILEDFDQDEAWCLSILNGKSTPLDICFRFENGRKIEDRTNLKSSVKSVPSDKDKNDIGYANFKKLINNGMSSKVKVLTNDLSGLNIGDELVYNNESEYYEFISEDEETSEEVKSYGYSKISLSQSIVDKYIKDGYLEYVIKITTSESKFTNEFYISPKVYKGFWNTDKGVYELTDTHNNPVYVSEFGFHQLFKVIE